MPHLEIASFSPTSALTASLHGATRIELCQDASLGGTTPLLTSYLTLKSQISIPINVMIRPRGGDFVYTSQEINVMIDQFFAFEVEPFPDGFVFGILTLSGLVDEEKCKLFIDLARGIPCTFHRAFDEIDEEEMEGQLEVLIELGFKAVLTSGGKKSAFEGKEVLKKLVEVAKGRIEIIIGGGVRSSNVEELKAVTGAEWFHSSGITDVETEDPSPEEIEALIRILKS